MQSGTLRLVRLSPVVIALSLVLAQTLGAQTSAPNLNPLKGEMKVFEAVINETLVQTFAPPFGLLEKAQGSYLSDYGVIFSLEVNLYPVRMPNMFNLQPPTKDEVEKARKAKLERIAIIKRTMPRLLADHASALHDFPSEESVAVIVHLFHFQPEGENLPTQLVIQVKRSDIDQYSDRKLSYDQFLTHVKFSDL
ncbi:MAG TPA: hypothetical protein VKV95_18460 [Terriglobia bacterium]|nr:hypothetical protein [Terriglobia bacterium]